MAYQRCVNSERTPEMQAASDPAPLNVAPGLLLHPVKKPSWLGCAS
jgi:hypothetical protein